MKPLKGDQQLRSVSLSYSVALQALKPNPLSKKKGRRGLDASTDRGLTERSGEVFSLDILSHRMSAIEIIDNRQRPLQYCWGQVDFYSTNKLASGGPLHIV